MFIKIYGNWRSTCKLQDNQSTYGHWGQHVASPSLFSRWTDKQVDAESKHYTSTVYDMHPSIRVDIHIMLGTRVRVDVGAQYIQPVMHGDIESPPDPWGVSSGYGWRPTRSIHLGPPGTFLPIQILVNLFQSTRVHAARWPCLDKQASMRRSFKTSDIQ